VTFVLLLMGHALADFSLQNEWMAKHKNRHIGPSYIPPGQVKQTTWPYVLSAHALIHGLMVALITGNPLLGAAETVCHWIIDFGKCESWYGIHLDQSMHVLCKVAWAVMAWVQC
jgi:hypothetical protein